MYTRIYIKLLLSLSLSLSLSLFLGVPSAFLGQKTAPLAKRKKERKKEKRPLFVYQGSKEFRRRIKRRVPPPFAVFVVKIIKKTDFFFSAKKRWSGPLGNEQNSDQFENPAPPNTHTHTPTPATRAQKERSQEWVTRCAFTFFSFSRVVFFFSSLSLSLSSRSKLSRLGRDASLSLISAFFVCLLINKPHTLFEKSRFAFAFCRKKAERRARVLSFFIFFSWRAAAAKAAACVQSRETPQEERLTHFVLSLAFVPGVVVNKQSRLLPMMAFPRVNRTFSPVHRNITRLLFRRSESLAVAPLWASKPALLAPLSGSSVTLEGYGSCCFKGAVADKYLKEQGYGASLLKDLSWPKDEVKAKAVLHYCRGRQIMARSNIRIGFNRWRARAFVTATLVACKWLCLTLTRMEFHSHRFRTKICCKAKRTVPPTRTAG